MKYLQISAFTLIAYILSGCSVAVIKSESSSSAATPSHSASSALLESDTSGEHFKTTAEFYRSISEPGQADVAKLNLFFTKMPKGGDLHHHYSGSVYAETYLDWVKNKGWLIDECTLEIVKAPTESDCKQLTVAELLANDPAYRKLLSLWSDKDFGNHIHITPPPDEKFFNTFGFFGPIADDFIPTGLNILKQRALNENVAYIETMLSQVGVSSTDYFDADEIKKINATLQASRSQDETDLVLNQITETLLASDKFNSRINQFVDTVKANHTGIDDDRFMMRYQTYAVRVLDPLSVFTDLISGYLAANQSPLVVGVNIVAPENNFVALRDYTLHMRMYNYLLRKYPQVNRALHAGELTLGMVRPKNLLFHIRQALEIAQAQRIGHGVDLPYEHDAIKLLEQLKP
ncbi:MAG: adenosine deaminase, partial [bacterium]